ncbi:conserved protein of unknown function [Tenacibaculum sp. 190524A02b]|uniref:hypothetical protein n=1 Tax=Tenacibaculum vairaonense TaxID=3137860 RepID=UPI0032B25BB2
MDDFLSFIANYSVIIISIIFLIFIIRYLMNKHLKKHHSNWNTLIDNFEYSPTDFYSLLSKELLSHGIKNIKVTTEYLAEGGPMSRYRTYLRATWRGYQYDICASKFGDGFFISWWLLYKNSFMKMLISLIPFVGKWIAEMWFPITYYRVDTASMFMSYAQNSVLKVIDDITNDKGVRALTEAERKPMLNNIFNR